MRRLHQQIQTIAPYDTTVLIQGESGTGKELAAHLIHEHSARRDQPLIPVSCTSLCPTVLESELFGHERGAFTSAAYRHRGKLERADGGTLFLDEISAASPLLQQRLLRVLQEHTFERVGGRETLSVDFRLVAATHTDLAQAMAEGHFREDLYYRLNVITLEIPPLRERREDIPELADHFLKRYCRQFGKEGLGLTTQTMDVLLDYDWPGNVRELQHAIERAVLLSRSSCIEPEYLVLRRHPPVTRSYPVEPGRPLHEAMAGFERTLLEEALRRCRGNVVRAAAQLGISRKGLYNRMQHCGVDPERYRDDFL